MLNKLNRLIKGPKLDPYTPLNRTLSDVEVKSLRDWIRRDDTQLAMRLVTSLKPSLFTDQSGTPELVRQRESAKLNQLRGWATCFQTFTSLLDQGNDKKTTEITENWE